MSITIDFIKKQLKRIRYLAPLSNDFANRAFYLQRLITWLLLIKIESNRFIKSIWCIVIEVLKCVIIDLQQ